MFSSIKFTHGLGIDFIYSQNWNRVFELIKEMYIIVKYGVLNKFYNMIIVHLLKEKKYYEAIWYSWFFSFILF
jgi:hypothetical protein